MEPRPTHLSFIRAALPPLAAGLASLALCACLHCATAPPAVEETQTPVLTVIPERETSTKVVPSCGASARSANHSPCDSVRF